MSLQVGRQAGRGWRRTAPAGAPPCRSMPQGSAAPACRCPCLRGRCSARVCSRVCSCLRRPPAQTSTRLAAPPPLPLPLPLAPPAETDKFLQAAADLAGPYQWGVYDVLLLPPSFPYGGMVRRRLRAAGGTGSACGDGTGRAAA